ncbi:MAG: electron transfer flavoprotein subunit beta, partial [Candidatus Lokiarchaeota archaeon]|nr:electron transfer flavoprotein subunit beta [Candidatus Lokiarchaeota archaeon]
MKVIVCIKQVPGVSEVKIDEKGLLVREGIPSIINPMDKNGIELAIQLKEKYDAETIVLSMGPPQAEEALREALAMGIDKAYLLTDRAFAGA